MPLGTVITEPDQSITHAYFIEEGLCSVVSRQIGGGRVEIGLFGRDGVSGTALLLGADRIPHEIFMQVAGRGHRVSAAVFQRAAERSRDFRDLLLRYTQTFLIQTAQTALANAAAPAEERLARWLLMYHDRQDGDDLSVTHDFLSMMLGVRRPTVTVAIHVLEGAGLIRARRGRVTVLERRRLEEAAGESYGTAEAEYERLVGPLRRCPPAPYDSTFA
nr:Crp/Fnr family transcriptional regulator [Methylobacterium brachythecii]